jgi:hypothetical protein
MPATPQLTKDWIISPNVRLTPFVSLVATMGWWAYENKVRLLAGGWTLVGTSDGATAGFDGPGTDRITSAATFATQGATTATVKSWYIVENSLGCQLLIAYEGATADICLISYSQGGLFVINSPATHTPTAVDVCTLMTGTSVIHGTASLDRVMSIWVAEDSWSCAIFRGGSYVNILGVEGYDSAVPTVIQAAPMIGYRFTTLIANTAHEMINNNNSLNGQADFRGLVTHHTYLATHRNTRLLAVTCGFNTGGGVTAFIATNNAVFNTTNQGPLQNGAAMPLLPIMMIGHTIPDANNVGYAGILKDWWHPWGPSADFGDFFPGLDPADLPTDPPRTNWLCCVGPMMARPWRNAAASMQAT